MEEEEEEVECTRTCLPTAVEGATTRATSSLLPWDLVISTPTKVECAEEVNMLGFLLFSLKGELDSKEKARFYCRYLVHYL